MNTELTHDEILENYVKLDNTAELLDSDILILPIDRKNAYLLSQPLDLKKGYPDMNIKYYAQDQDKIQYCLTASVWSTIEMGSVIISSIASLITIADFVMKQYGNKENTLISIHLYSKTVNNTFICHDYKGDVHTFCNSELVKMENDFKAK